MIHALHSFHSFHGLRPFLGAKVNLVSNQLVSWNIGMNHHLVSNFQIFQGRQCTTFFKLSLVRHLDCHRFLVRGFHRYRSVGNASGNGYDLVISNGRVLDPASGLDAVRNIGIQNFRIETVTDAPLQGHNTIDAAGLVVAPGFIDLHQHGQDAENYRCKAADGVTTALELEQGTADVDGWYAAREGKALINYGTSVGHVLVRMAVMKDPGTTVPTRDAARRVASDERDCRHEA